MTEQELVRRFHQAVTDISALAEAIGELHWKRAFFDKAARTLENESMPPTNTACLMSLKRPLRLCMKYVRRQWRI